MQTTCPWWGRRFSPANRIISRLLSEWGPTLMPAGGGLHAALHLFLGDILYMGSHPPVVAAHVPDAAAAVAVELVLRLRERRPAGGHRAGVDGVDILHVEMQGGWHGLQLIARLANHDYGIADPHLGMADAAVGHGHTEYFLRVERRFHEVDQFAGALHYKVRRDGVIPLWDCFDGDCFGWSAHGDILCYLRYAGGCRFYETGFMKLRQIAEALGCLLAGDGELEILGVAGMEHASAGQLTFLANPK